MKQQRLGQKVVNWHRPLRSDRLKRRYERRYEDETRARIKAYFQSDPLSEQDWEEDLYWVFENAATDLDFAVHAALSILGQGGAPQFHALLRLIDRQADSIELGQGREDAAAQEPRSHEALGQRLVDHIHQLANSHEIVGWLPTTIQTALQNQDELAILQQLANNPVAKERVDQGGLLAHVVLFSPFWIRPLATWVPKGDTSQQRAQSLVEHLFALYPIPNVLVRAWLVEPERRRMKWICWSILWGNGYSLYHAADRFEWQLTRKFQRHFEQAPAHLEPSLACMYAEVLRVGGSVVEFERLRANPAYIIDPTERSQQGSFLPFWQDAVLWLARQRDALSDQEAHVILTWAMHRYTESVRMQEEPFTLRGRSVRRVSAEALEFWEAMRRPHSTFQWKKRGWEWEYVDEEGTEWTFVELTSGGQLFEEGQRLTHCVSGYAGRCAAGYSAIVSMRKANIPTITIEVSPRTKKIVQARGLYNREMYAEERRIVNHWQAAVLQNRSSEYKP